MMTIKEKTIRLHSLVKATVLGVIALAILSLSFSPEDNGTTTFMFPQLLAFVYSLTILFGIFSDLKNANTEAIVLQLSTIKRFIPGFLLVIMYVYIADIVGFYISSWLFLLITFVIYNKSWKALTSQNNIEGFKSIIIDLITSVMFTLFMYILFTIMLRVQVY